MLITSYNMLSKAVQFSEDRSRLRAHFNEQLCICMQLHVMLKLCLSVKHAFISLPATYFLQKNLLTFITQGLKLNQHTISTDTFKYKPDICQEDANLYFIHNSAKNKSHS